ncbi:hypothetical protein [Micromonospora echinospora]|uniref:hypothetical protein n=1 Tax=Micromonospora echinospora TaxID=1877 RepID=UPI00117E87D7|nr:hypothetical protein [Micromonospora echinospora]
MPEQGQIIFCEHEAGGDDGEPEQSEGRELEREKTGLLWAGGKEIHVVGRETVDEPRSTDNTCTCTDPPRSTPS